MWVSLAICLPRLARSRFDLGDFSILFFLSFVISQTLAVIAMKIKPATADYAPFFVIAARIATTCLIIYWRLSETGSFAAIDLKQFHTQIQFVAVPYLTLSFVNWKFSIMVTGPITIVTTYIVSGYSLTTKDDNMTCFADPETYASDTSIGVIILQIFLLFFAYVYRLNTLERFVDQQTIQKQQDQLQSIFDN